MLQPRVFWISVQPPQTPQVNPPWSLPSVVNNSSEVQNATRRRSSCPKTPTMNGFPHSPAPDAGPRRPEEPLLAEWLAKPPRRRWLSRLAGAAFVLLMIGLVVGPIAYVKLPQEITWWHLAAAQERRLDGDLDAALRSLDRLLEESPGNVDLLTTRADWRMQNQTVCGRPVGCESCFGTGTQRSADADREEPDLSVPGPPFGCRGRLG